MTSNQSPKPVFLSPKHIRLQDLDLCCNQKVHQSDYPFASVIEKNIVVYHGDRLREASHEAALAEELHRCLGAGPGVFVVKGAYPDLSAIDRTTALFHEIIAREKAAGSGRGDHFGSNERIWNSIQKTCVLDPDLFINYYGNPILALASRAWLGPFYQITAQVNNVKPGNAAQSPHRDYHLGFQSDDVVAQFPLQVQAASQFLTLQGAVAHTDMPLESGPTLFLPFSQQFPAGYMAYRRPEFIDYFNRNYVQLPLQKGDAVFFSPALFHGAGANQSPNERLANLVQISSAFGRPMETVNRFAMIEAVYPALLDRVRRSAIADRHLHDTIAALADGYSFPTNLDSDPPIGGHAPETAQVMLDRALAERWDAAALKAQLLAYAGRREA